MRRLTYLLSIALAGSAIGQNCVDVDGNVYNTVEIGNQLWMSENLRTTSYDNGDPISSGLSDTQWAAAVEGAYAIYMDDPAIESTYGKLYNGYAATDPRGLCPTNWRVPTFGDFAQLYSYLGGSSLAGGHLKSLGYWNSPNVGATNASGFTGLPAGDRWAAGNYGGLGGFAYFWTATPTNLTNQWHGGLASYTEFYLESILPKRYGLSCRCLLNGQLGVDDRQGSSRFIRLVGPNPARDVLRIELLEQVANYKLINDLGQTVGQGLLDRGVNDISLLELVAGVYMLQTESEPHGSLRFVKE